MTGHEKISGILPDITASYNGDYCGVWSKFVIVMGLVSLLPVAGCSSTTPQSQAAGSSVKQSQIGEVPPKRAGIYPNFAVMPTGATEQLTVEEASLITQKLASDKLAQGRGPVVKGTDRAALQRKKLELEAERDATLRQIEAN